MWTWYWFHFRQVILKNKDTLCSLVLSTYITLCLRSHGDVFLFKCKALGFWHEMLQFPKSALSTAQLSKKFKLVWTSRQVTSFWSEHLDWMAGLFPYILLQVSEHQTWCCYHSVPWGQYQKQVNYVAQARLQWANYKPFYSEKKGHLLLKDDWKWLSSLALEKRQKGKKALFYNVKPFHFCLYSFPNHIFHNVEGN